MTGCKFHHRLTRTRLKLAGIPDVEARHRQQHQYPVEDVRGPLSIQKITILPHHILDHAIDIARYDGQGGHVQHVQAGLPGNIPNRASRGPKAAEPYVEDHGTGHEDGEHDDLNDQPADDDVFARLRAVGAAIALGQKSGTGSLDEETDAVAEDEEARRPARGDG